MASPTYFHNTYEVVKYILKDGKGKTTRRGLQIHEVNDDGMEVGPKVHIVEVAN